MGLKRFAAAAITIGVLLMASAAQAAPSWSDGPVERSYITNCPSIIFGNPYVEEGAWTWTGQYLDPANPPDVNQTFYIHVVAGAVGNACSGQRVHFELLGTPNNVLQVDESQPIYCYAINWNTNPPSATQEPPFTSGGACPQVHQNGGVAGGFSYDAQTSPSSADPWPLPQGKGWEIQIPVRSPITRNGGFGACGDCNTFDSFILDGNNSPQLFPRQGLFVDNAGGGGATPGGTGGTTQGLTANVQKPPPTPAPAPVVKCKKTQKLKHGKCVKKKKKKKK